MHFTYSALDSKQLYQGDVLLRTDKLDAILQEVHPHYKKEDYKAFIVLTQSCDLAVRNGAACSARYISLAAVRPLSLVLQRAFHALCRSSWEREYRITSDKNREKLRLFVERLLNNNEDEYFFLYREPALGLEEDCCAFLQLSIAVKSELHFNSLLEAKRLQLVDSFQHKLGYLVGKMYSRVGTPDWVPSCCLNDSEFDKVINEIIAPKDFALWVPDDAYRHIAKKANGAIAAGDSASVTEENLVKWVDAFVQEKAKRKEDFVKAIEAAFLDVGVAQSSINKAVARLNSNATFKTAFRS